MSSELERRLEGVFAEAPEPDPGTGEEALHRALTALQPVAAPRRALRAGVLAFAAAVVLLVIAAGSLAAAGALHISIGAKTKPRPATTQLVLPKGANGIAAIVGGQLSMVARDGFRLQGLPVTLKRSDFDLHAEVNKDNALRLNLEADIVIVHDPQPIYLPRFTPKGKVGRWVWRCHIDASRPNRSVWKYLEKAILDYQATIFSMERVGRPSSTTSRIRSTAWSRR